jgi:hypothetical protein
MLFWSLGIDLLAIFEFCLTKRDFLGTYTFANAATMIELFKEKGNDCIFPFLFLLPMLLMLDFFTTIL